MSIPAVPRLTRTLATESGWLSGYVISVANVKACLTVSNPCICICGNKLHYSLFIRYLMCVLVLIIFNTDHPWILLCEYPYYWMVIILILV